MDRCKNNLQSYSNYWILYSNVTNEHRRVLHQSLLFWRWRWQQSACDNFKQNKKGPAISNLSKKYVEIQNKQITFKRRKKKQHHQHQFLSIRSSGNIMTWHSRVGLGMEWPSLYTPGTVCHIKLIYQRKETKWKREMKLLNYYKEMRGFALSVYFSKEFKFSFFSLSFFSGNMNFRFVIRASSHSMNSPSNPKKNWKKRKDSTAIVII